MDSHLAEVLAESGFHHPPILSIERGSRFAKHSVHDRWRSFNGFGSTRSALKVCMLSATVGTLAATDLMIAARALPRDYTCRRTLPLHHSLRRCDALRCNAHATGGALAHFPTPRYAAPAILRPSAPGATPDWS